MASATMPNTCLTSLPTLFTPKATYPFSSLPSKQFKPLTLSSPSPSPLSWGSLKNKFSPFPLVTFVASTSDWDENPVSVAEAEAENGEGGLVEEDGSVGEGEFVDPPEEAKLFVGNLPPVSVVEAEAENGEDGSVGEGEFVDPPEEAKLFVGNLPYDVTSEAMAQLFEQAGTVEVSEVIYNRDTDQSRGFGFVWMQTIEESLKAIEMFNGYDLNGRYLTVNKAAPRGSRPERAPRIFEPSFRVYVGNLPWEVDDSRLEQVFSEHGKVVQARVVYDRETGRSRGFGFVSFSTQSEVNDAIEALDGQELEGRAIRVNVAEERPRRNSF